MSIELPKDTEGREIPLDTKMLYDENGKCFKVNHFTYSVVQTIPNLKWGVVFMNCRYDYCSSFYLTPPEPPDSWERLEEDLGRAAERDVITSQCRYFNTTNRCVNCPIRNDIGGCTHKDERAFGDILDRIRKLRGKSR